MAYVHKGSSKTLYNRYEDPHNILIEEIGPGYAIYRREWEETTKFNLKKTFPIQLDFELNVSCNLKCPMCTWSATETFGQGKTSWMDLEFYKKLVQEGVENGLRAVNLNYVNEPLIRPDLYEFVKFARDVGVVEVMFNTNGLLLTDDMTVNLIDAGLTKLSISIDAFTPETYAIVRPGGDYNKLLEIIHRFLVIRAEKSERMPLLKLTFLKMSTNIHELEPFLGYWEDKADLFSIQNLHNPFDGDLRDAKNRYYVGGPPDLAGETPRCPSPFQRMTVRFNGDVLPCCNFRAATDLVVGNAKNSDLSSIWNSKKMSVLRETHVSGRYQDNPVCKACIDNSQMWAPEVR